MSNELVSAIQQGLRTFAIGEIFVLIAVVGIVNSGINTELGTFVIQWNVAAAVVAGGTLTNIQTALGSALDKFLYAKGIDTPLNFKPLDELRNKDF